ncbi:hypothetical protein RFI_32244, partial [Reticulomyxa filosa]
VFFQICFTYANAFFPFFNLLNCISIFGSLKKTKQNNLLTFCGVIKYIRKVHFWEDVRSSIRLDEFNITIDDNNSFTTKEGHGLFVTRETIIKQLENGSHNEEVFFEVGDCVLLEDKITGQSQFHSKFGCIKKIYIRIHIGQTDMLDLDWSYLILLQMDAMEDLKDNGTNTEKF